MDPIKSTTDDKSTEKLETDNGSQIVPSHQVRRLESSLSHTTLQDAQMSADNITLSDHARIDHLTINTPHKTESEFIQIITEKVSHEMMSLKQMGGSTEQPTTSQQCGTLSTNENKEFYEFVKSILPVATLCGGFIVTLIKDETPFRHPSLLMGSMLTAVLYFDRPPSSRVTKKVEDTLCAHCHKVAKASKCVLYVCTAIHINSSLQKGFHNFQEEFMEEFDNNEQNELDTLGFWGMTFITDRIVLDREKSSWENIMEKYHGKIS